MCMEDIAIGRETSAIARTRTLPAGAAGTLATPDPKRIALTIASAGAATVWVGPNGITPSATQGIPLPTAQPAMTFTLELHGRMVQQAWQGFSVAGEVCSVIEVTLEREK